MTEKTLLTKNKIDVDNAEVTVPIIEREGDIPWDPDMKPTNSIAADAQEWWDSLVADLAADGLEIAPAGTTANRDSLWDELHRARARADEAEARLAERSPSVVFAPEISDDSWLNDDRHDGVAEFRERLEYARTQTRFIQASTGVKPEALFYIWSALNRATVSPTPDADEPDTCPTCPTCGSDDKRMMLTGEEAHPCRHRGTTRACCPNDWHP